MKQSDTPTYNFGQTSNQHPFQVVVLKILSFFEIQIQYFHMDIKNLFPMSRITVNYILFLGVQNWLSVHSQTMKYVENISTPCDGKAKHVRIFQIALRDRGDISPCSGSRGNGKFLWSQDSFIEFVEEKFWPLKPFSNLKAAFCKYWTSKKPTLAWPVYTNRMMLKWKWYRSNDYS